MQIPLDLLINNNITNQPPNTDKPTTRRYWPVPPLIDHVVEYQNINKDINLRKDVTKFFHEKVIKWINEYDEFKIHKSKLSFLKTTDGQMYIYNLLRHFVKKSGINWYDLRDNYSILKEYLSKKL
jgi:hypothetical protein